MQNHLKATFRRIIELEGSSTLPITNQDSSDVDIIPAPVSKLEARNQQMARASSNREITTIDRQIDNLIFERLSVNSNVCEYWKSQKSISPDLYKLAQVVLAVPATQVSVERSFSALNLILNNRRTSLSEKTLKEIMFVKLNKSLFNYLKIDY